MPVTQLGGKGIKNVRRRNRVAKLRDQGLGVTDIARKLGVTTGTIGYYLKSLEVGGGNPYKVKKVKKGRMAPIVLGSTVNGSGNTLSDGVVINNAALLDLLWKRLTTEEKVKAIKGLED